MHGPLYHCRKRPGIDGRSGALSLPVPGSATNACSRTALWTEQTLWPTCYCSLFSVHALFACRTSSHAFDVHIERVSLVCLRVSRLAHPVDHSRGLLARAPALMTTFQESYTEMTALARGAGSAAVY